MRESRWSYFAAAAALVAVTWWLEQILAPPPEAGRREIAHRVDYYANDFTRTETDVAGSPKSRLQALDMKHYEDDQTSDLSKPVMHFFRAGMPPWVVSADTGIMSGDGNTVFLGGKTVASRDPYQGHLALEAISRDVTVHLDKQYLESKAFTEIFHLPHYTAGVGMRTDFADGMQIHLMSEVRGRYEN